MGFYIKIIIFVSYLNARIWSTCVLVVDLMINHVQCIPNQCCLFTVFINFPFRILSFFYFYHFSYCNCIFRFSYDFVLVYFILTDLTIKGTQNKHPEISFFLST